MCFSMTKKVIPVKQISQPPVGGCCTVFSLCMVVNFYGIKISPRKLLKYFDNCEKIKEEGAYLSEASDAAKKLWVI